MTVDPQPAEPSPVPSPADHAATRGTALLGALLVLAGCAWLLSVAGLVDIELRSGIALLVIGLGAVVALDAGHAHGGLVVLAVVLALAGATLTWVDVDASLLRGGIGERTVVPASAAEAAAGYTLGVGKLTLDLTRLPAATEHAVTRVEAQLGVGQLDVRVARAARVVLDVHVAVGEVNALGDTHGGLDVERRSVLDGPGRTVALEVRVGIGEVLVTRAP